MKKPKGLTNQQGCPGNGGKTHAAGRAKFEGTFKHPHSSKIPAMGAGAKKILGRG